LTALDFGSDIGGSIRVPAAFCGVYGHRPSETAIPRSGHFPGTPLPNAATVMGVQGPLARSAEDLELAFHVIAGPDVGEDQAWRLEVPPARHEEIAGFRVAVLPPISWLPIDSEVAAALDRVATRLGSAGAHVAEAQPQAFGDLREHQSVYLSLLTVMTSLGVPAEARASMAAAARVAVPGEFGEAQARGFEASAADYIQWFGHREQYRAAYRAFFREWDVLLAPAFPTPAFRHIGLEVPFGQRTHTVNDQIIPYIYGTALPALATLSGQPATAFPAGLTSTGLPVGLQAIGPYLEDRTPIRLTALLAQEAGGFQRPPGYGE
jgi:amidase